MILDASNKHIEIVLGEAIATTECDLTASWGSYTGSAFTPGGTSAVSNGTTPVVIVAAPASGTQRLVQEITLHNPDTIDHTVTAQLIDGANTRVFRQSVVPAGGSFAYSPSVAVPPVEASYFSLISGSPDTLYLRAPAPDHLVIYSGGGDMTASSQPAASGNTGAINIFSGDAPAGNSGDANWFTGDASGTSGAVFFGSGDTTGAGTSGRLVIGTGTSPGGASGDAYFYTGDAHGANAGPLTLAPGGVGSGTGNGGDIIVALSAGSGAGRSGQLIANLPTADPGVSGALWVDPVTHIVKQSP